MKKWMELVPVEERQTYEDAGWGQPATIGCRPVLLIIDVTLGFTGDRGQTLDEAIKKYTTACGPVSWETMPRICKLLHLFRRLNYPVVFTRSAADDTPFSGRATKSKVLPPAISPEDNAIPSDIAPLQNEWILEKTRASAFFQTSLTSFLVCARIDSVVVCGVSTSGCVRATVVDSFSNGFETFVVDDCCFDRSYFSHCTNLFDMNAKYATVLSLNEVEERLDTTKVD